MLYALLRRYAKQLVIDIHGIIGSVQSVFE